MTARLLLIALALITVACDFSPRYCPPCVEMYEEWMYAEQETIPNDLNIRWWADLNDPVLNSLIDEALGYNRDLWIASERLCEFYQLWLRSESFRRPQVKGDARAEKDQLSPAMAPLEGFPRIQDAFILLSSVNWELDVWGRLLNNCRATWFEWLEQTYARRAVILTLVSNVATSYVTLREYDLQLNIAKDTLVSRKESLRLAKLRFQGGTTSEIEVKQAESEVEEAASTVNRFEVLIPQQENLLSVLVGSVPRQIKRGLPLAEINTETPIPVGVPASVLYQRPDVHAAEAHLIALGARVGSARAELFPNITLTGTLGQESIELQNLLTNQATVWSYAAQLTQIIFDGGRICANIGVVSSLQRQALYNYQRVVLNALKEVESALIAHSKAKELIEIQRRRVTALEGYVHLAHLQYDNGQTDYLQVLDAERHLFAAQLDLASAIANGVLTHIDVYKAIGGCWVVAAEEEVDGWMDMLDPLD